MLQPDLKRLRRVALSLSLLAAGCAPAALPAVPAAPAGYTAAPVARVADAPDRFFDAGDTRIRYRDLGRGEPIVLIHGFAGSLEWPPSADSLAVDHRVVVLDVRGFGESSKFADPSRLGPEMAEDVARLLDHLGLRRAHLAGHSMGTEDPLLADSEALVRWWPRARLRAVEGANHGTILVHPALLQEMRALVRSRRVAG